MLEDIGKFLEGVGAVLTGLGALVTALRLPKGNKKRKK